jgi:DNA-binding NtrC family response regulator
MIIVALEKAGGNKTKAAKLLNLSRSRLYDKLSKYNLKD